jgi:hypothetical protein
MALNDVIFQQNAFLSGIKLPLWVESSHCELLKISRPNVIAPEKPTY